MLRRVCDEQWDGVSMSWRVISWVERGAAVELRTAVEPEKPHPVLRMPLLPATPSDSQCTHAARCSVNSSDSLFSPSDIIQSDQWPMMCSVIPIHTAEKVHKGDASDPTECCRVQGSALLHFLVRVMSEPRADPRGGSAFGCWLRQLTLQGSSATQVVTST